MSNRENTTIRRNRQDYQSHCRDEMDRLAYDMHRIKCLSHVLFEQVIEADCYDEASADKISEITELCDVIYKIAKASYEAH